MPRSTNGRRDRTPGTPERGATPPLRPLSPEAERRVRAVNSLAWLLDRSIPLGRFRFGLDPLLGLIPGAGDWLGAVLSLFVLYQGARLGLPRHVLVQMAGNILVEAVVGALPLIGDAFDFVWKANARNAALLQRHYQTEMRPRSFRQIWLLVGLFAVAVLTLVALLAYFILRGVMAVFGSPA
jgi:hypothetical protein